MQKLTRFAFAISDAIAWLATLCLVFLMIPMTFFLPLFAAMDHEEAPSSAYVATLTGVELALVMLFYATLRKKAPAVVVLCLCILPAWVWRTKEDPALSLWGVVIFLAFFALPYGLAWYSMRLKRKESQTRAVSAAPDA